MQDINKRFESLEERLSKIEKNLDIGILATEQANFEKEGLRPMQDATKAETKPVTRKVAAENAVAEWNALNQGPSSSIQEPVSATQIMAWCAGLTFILAAVYFLKLVYDTGWLTPMRQIGIAYLAAGGLISTGFYVEKRDHQYAAYLPAIGLVVLYLTTFVAHLHYELFGSGSAMAMVGVTTLLGIWLGRKFDNSVYVIFSAIGVYVTPLLIHSKTPDITDLVIYYSAWSLLFSFCSVQEGRRITYLLPMYLAMLGFDWVWRMTGGDEWQIAANYQFIQFLIFASTTAFYSVVHKAPIDEESAWAHGVALFIFYGIEYTLLKEHIPDLVNYFALASGGFVWMLYYAASKLYEGKKSLTHGATLVSYYCSWVVVNGLFFGEISGSMLPWAALITPFVFIIAASNLKGNTNALMPISLACGGLFLLGYGMLLMNVLIDSKIATPMPTMALFIYVFLLYGVYGFFSKTLDKIGNTALMLYAGHLGFISCLIEWVENDIYLSSLWAVYGIALLVLSLAVKDKVIGKSALIVFTAAALKVLLFDLSGSNSMVRVLVLLVLSVSLYLGGYLYQSVVREADASEAA